MTGRDELEVFGKKGRPYYVRVVREKVRGAPRIRVLWTVDGKRKSEGFSGDREGLADAKTFAEQVFKELMGVGASTPATASEPPTEAVTLRALSEAYVKARLPRWRQKSLLTHNARWSKLETILGHRTPASTITRDTCDDLVNRMMAMKYRGERPMSVYQVKQHVQLLVRVFRHAVERDLILPTKVTSYVAQFGRDQKRQKPKMAEYSADERTKLAGAISPRDRRQWRLWVATVLFAYCGPRKNAALQLEWSDVDFAAGRLQWRPEVQKMGEDYAQPMPAPVREALWVAYGWRLYEEYTGRYVFFGAQRRTRGQALRRNSRREKQKESLEGIVVHEKPWTYQAYLAGLHRVERQLGITPILFRGTHGFRRGLAGDIHAATGSEKAAADWLGDKSVKVVRDSYLLRREEELRSTADRVTTLMQDKQEE